MGLKRTLRKYRDNESGQFAVITALLGVPILMAVTAALDYSSAQSEYTSVKGALDIAALAAATNNRVNLAEKERIAEQQFVENYTGRAKVTAKATAKGDMVEIVATGYVPFSVSEAFGLDGIDINTKSAAIRSEENVICVLALSETADNAISFSGDVEFFSPNCSVHSNSKSRTAISSRSTKTPIAKTFCATGGAVGSYSPYVKADCLPVKDPYVNVAKAPVGRCSLRTMLGSSGAIGARLSNRFGQDRTSGLFDRTDEQNATGNGTILRPGTYCGGIIVDGRNVEFMPGDYIIKDGPLIFLNGAEAKGEGVTFGFTGKKAVLNVIKGADVTLVGPSSGARKGIVFMQMEDTKVTKSASSNKRHVISGGGQLNIVGTAYFPTQEIFVSGSGTQMGAKAPATSFIADRLTFEGESGSRVNVQSDHEAAGLPPLLPRAEAGARLIY